jgi:neurofibromin 1
MCLTRLLPLLSPESKIHKFMFWIALSILQLEETQLYASGLALLEQNLHTLDHMLSLFENTSTHQQQTLERIMMDAREPLEWQFKQLDASMGLSFKSYFNFALVGHLIKGTKKNFLKSNFHLHLAMDIVDHFQFYFLQLVGYNYIHSN